MRVLFVILNFQTFCDTITLTKEIVAQKAADDAILIIDNNSPNDSYTIIKRELNCTPDVTIIKTDSNCGFARGNNYGLRYAKRFAPQYVCIINNDVRFSYTMIEHLCEIYPSIPDAGMIAPIQLDINNQPAKFTTLSLPDIKKDIKNYLFFLNNKLHTYKSNCDIPNIQQVGIIPGAFMFTNYELFESIGFFCEDTFLYCEERFVAREFLSINKKNYIILDQTYRHEHSKTISSFYGEQSQRKMILKGRMLYAQKYYTLPKLKCVLIKALYTYNYIGNLVIMFIKNKVKCKW